MPFQQVQLETHMLQTAFLEPWPTDAHHCREHIVDDDVGLAGENLARDGIVVFDALGRNTVAAMRRSSRAELAGKLEVSGGESSYLPVVVQIYGLGNPPTSSYATDRSS